MIMPAFLIMKIFPENNAQHWIRTQHEHNNTFGTVKNGFCYYFVHILMFYLRHTYALRGDELTNKR